MRSATATVAPLNSFEPSGVSMRSLVNLSRRSDHGARYLKTVRSWPRCAASREAVRSTNRVLNVVTRRLVGSSGRRTACSKAASTNMPATVGGHGPPAELTRIRERLPSSSPAYRRDAILATGTCGAVSLELKPSGPSSDGVAHDRLLRCAVSRSRTSVLGVLHLREVHVRRRVRSRLTEDRSRRLAPQRRRAAARV